MIDLSTSKPRVRFFLILLILFIGHLIAIEPIDLLQHDVFTVADGLPMNTINRIVQTFDGFLWCGTEAGLVRFDGINIRIFNRENSPAITSDIIVSLTVDRSGVLWVGCREGGVLRYEKGKFTAINSESGLQNNDVLTLMAAMDGTLWIGSRGGLNMWRAGTLERIALPKEIAGAAITTLLEDRLGVIWVGTNGQGLIKLRRHCDSIETERVGSPHWWLTTLFEDRKGTIWMGTRESGLYCWEATKCLAFSFSNGLSTNHIQCLYEDRFGNMWIGTQGGGINIYSASVGRMTRYDREDDLKHVSVLHFFEDLEGTLWIGTGGNGLNRLRETEITTYSIKNGLSSANVYGIFQDSKGRIWSGSKGHGINILENRRFRQLTTVDGLVSNSVVSFAEDLDGGIWIGTLGNGLNRFKNGRFDLFTTEHGLSRNSTRSVYVDPKGILWVGTIDGGIHRFEGKGFKKVADVHSRVNAMQKDSHGDLWVATFGAGLCRVKKDQVEIFDTQKGLSSNIVTSIYEDKDGQLWIGTVRGLNRFQAGHIDNIFKKDGLPDELLYCILADKKGDFWISCNRGIYRLRYNEAQDFLNGIIKRVNPVLYGKESGMLSAECNGGNQPSGCKSHDGKLWFPSTGGISVIDPMNVGINKTPPPLVIEKIIADGKERTAHEPDVLVFNSGKLMIHYTAPAFIVPRKIRFRYRLQGWDIDWVDAGSRRVAEYNNLPSGEYRFQVIASNNDGVWNTTGSSVALQRRSNIYQTPVFKTIFFVLLAMVGLVSFYYFAKGINLRKIKSKSPMNTTMDTEEVNRCIKKLLYALEVEKIYRNPDLKIKILASLLVVSPRNLSRIINDRLGTHFYELVNEHRIKEAQRILSTSEGGGKSILDISLEVGYNSKSAFNRAFKNFTGLTPSQFKKKHQS
jgi:ligand-binding sensor domain-containing protein/AraC-like DNA-binding protein